MIYLESSQYADEQAKKGIHQYQCSVCRLWLWPCEIAEISNLIPKPEAEEKRIKGYCSFNGDIITAVSHGHWGFNVPCTIIIKAKDYKKMGGR